MLERRATVSHERVVVLTQSCDLANDKTTNVQVAVAHEARRLVELGLLKEHTIRDQVRRHRVFGWYFLPTGQNQPESIVLLTSIIVNFLTMFSGSDSVKLLQGYMLCLQ
jgi:hypothetical protein